MIQNYFLCLSGLVYGYYGVLIGSLSTLHHDVSGDVYARDESTLFIKNFTFDGNAPGKIFDLLYLCHGPLTRYTKLRVAPAPGMPGRFSPPPRVSDPGMFHGTCVSHVPWCMPGSLTSGFHWSRRRGKHSQQSWRMRNPQFCFSDKRPIWGVRTWHSRRFRSVHLPYPRT